MSIGTIFKCPTIQVSGLSPNTTNYEMQLYCKDQVNRYNAGYVSAKKKFKVYLWNGLYSDVVLSDIGENDQTEGMFTNVEVPYTIKGRTSLEVDFVLLSTGLVEFEALYSFYSNAPINPTVTVYGTRPPAPPSSIGYLFLPHNWEKGLTENLIWKTDVMVSYDRTEQRMQLRDIPRRSWDIEVHAQGDLRRYIEGWLSMRKTRYILSPIWRDINLLAFTITEDDTLILLQEVSDNYVVGGYVSVWLTETSYEVKKIVGLGSGYVTVDTPFNKTWPSNKSYVAPCRMFIGSGTKSISRKTDDLSVFTVNLRATEDGWEPPGRTFETFGANIVCPFTPSFEYDNSETLDNKWVVLDNDTGVLVYDMQSTEPVISRTEKFIIEGRENILTFLSFLKELSGKRVPFWIEAPDTSFSIVVPSSAGANYITISNIGYTYQYFGSNARSYIKLEFTDGSYLYRNIVNSEILPSTNEKLTVNPALDVSVTPTNVRKGSWFELVRLDSDNVSIQWEHTDLIIVSLPIVVLP